MLKNRLIPILFLKDNFLVRSEKFDLHQRLGNPVAQVERYNDWNVDELIYLDISKGKNSIVSNKLNSSLFDNIYECKNIIEYVSSKCFMPLTFGGGIRTLNDAEKCFFYGADKISINHQAIKSPNFIGELARNFGSQAIVVSVDIKINNKGKYEVFSGFGKISTGMDPIQWCLEIQERGAGEILLNSIDRDGCADGYDIPLIFNITSKLDIPVIACGGVGDYNHFKEGIEEGGASAVAAGNIFNFRELAYPLAKKYLKKNQLNFR
tara:strand:+ start:202 stop:996 length:795 start_codon:yes stop_codon:yes gene_type:complete